MKTGAVIALSITLILVGITDARLARADEPYALGVVLGFTGAGAPYSREALEGIEVAVDEINAEGGFLGKHPVKLFTKNTRTRPEVAKAAVRDLLRDHRARAVIGTYSSDTALAIKPILREARVLHIATISNSEDITRLEPSPYTFSVVPNTYMMAKGVAVGIAQLARQNNWKTYATIASDYAWGRSSQRVQVQILSQLAPELELIEQYWPPLGHVGFNTFVAAIRGQKPDFVLASIAGADNNRWELAVADYRLADHTVIAGGLLSVTELIAQANWIRRGTYGRTRAPFFAHPDVPMMARFIAAYRARYDRYPSDWAVMAYDGVQALRQGIEKAESIDTESVKDALRGATIDTTRGRLFFREIDNQLSCSAYFGRVADDPNYDFPIYAGMVELKGPDIWRPEAEIRAARDE